MPINKFTPATHGALPPLPVAPVGTGPDKTSAPTATTHLKQHAVLSERPPQQAGAATPLRRRATFDSLRSAFQASSTQAEAAAKGVRGRITGGDLKLRRTHSLPVIKAATSVAANGMAGLMAEVQKTP
jgi:hypothetical protein